MKKFIEKLIERLEEIPVGFICSECPNILKCNEIEDSGMGEKVDLCGATIKQLAIEIVNQLAEEYNNDFCEWHKVKNGNAYKCNTHAEIHDSRVLDWYVCPYCGKKIKVVE